MAREAESPTSEKIKFKSRASFCRLDKPKAFETGAKERWETTFLLDPANKEHLADIRKILKAAADLSREAYGVVPLAVRKLGAKFLPDAKPVDPNAEDDEIRVAFYNGSKKEYDGFEGMFVVPAHNTIKPAVANRAGKGVEPGEPQFPYSGCYVIGSITLWAHAGQTLKKYGKRIGVNLRGVQFYQPGEAFGMGEIAPEDEFEGLGDDESAAADAANDWG